MPRLSVEHDRLPKGARIPAGRTASRQSENRSLPDSREHTKNPTRRVGAITHFRFEQDQHAARQLGHYDAAVIVTDHTSYDYKAIVEQSQLVVDTGNATRGSTRRRSCAAEGCIAGPLAHILRWRRHGSALKVTEAG